MQSLNGPLHTLLGLPKVFEIATEIVQFSRIHSTALGAPVTVMYLGIVTAGVGCVNLIEAAEVLRDSYDYVTAGGGTARLTVADRLSSDGKRIPW